MNPRDRLLAALRKEKPDRVPLVLHGLIFPTRERIDALQDPARREIAHRIFDETAAEVRLGSHVNRYFVTPPQFMKGRDVPKKDGTVTTTTEIRTPRGPLTAVTERNALTDTIWTIKYPVESLEDIEKIRSIPWELPAGLAAPDLSRKPATFDQK